MATDTHFVDEQSQYSYTKLREAQGIQKLASGQFIARSGSHCQGQKSLCIPQKKGVQKWTLGVDLEDPLSLPQEGQ